MAETLPRWDMSVVYPGLDSPEYQAAVRDLARELDGLEALFDRRAIQEREPAELAGEDIQALEEILETLNHGLEALATLNAFAYAFVSTDSRDAVAQREMSVLEQQRVRLEVLSTRLKAWIGSLDVEGLIAASGPAAQHAFMLRKASQEAAHLMSPAEEELAAKLALTGSTAWNKLYESYSSQIMVPFDRDTPEEGQEPPLLPISAIRNLAYDPDRGIRQRAYQAELAAWKRSEVTILAAMNSIKGETNTLTQRRRWPSPLEEALFQSHIDRHTLDAMMAAAQESFPDFRRYLRAKARALRLDRLCWYDLFAPVGEEEQPWPFHEAAQFIVAQFRTYSERLADLAQRAFQERWVDAEPREGKVGGAYCMWLRHGESRILANYAPVYGEVSTLAHELGHAYHNLAKKERTPLQRATPMTLAETASIFCQTIVQNAVLQQVGPAEQFTILEASLQDACQVVVDISSRFLFEQSLFARRRQRDLSAQELSELMLEAQRQTYGDGLDPEALHPYMWAVKPHYYATSFYNYPYMFGQLFGLGLYAQYVEDPEGFKAGYDDLLASTGMGSAAELASRFGFDLRQIDFWRGSLDVIRADIERFEQLVAAQTHNEEG